MQNDVPSVRCSLFSFRKKCNCILLGYSILGSFSRLCTPTGVVDVNGSFLLVNIDHTAVFYWLTSTTALFFWSISTKKGAVVDVNGTFHDHMLTGCTFSAGRRRRPILLRFSSRLKIFPIPMVYYCEVYKVGQLIMTI